MAKSKKAKRKKTGADDPNDRVVARNRRARHDYDFLDTLEAGIVLIGSEVKSVRAGLVNIEGAFATVKGDQLWLIDLDIAEYPQAGVYNHERKRHRKLLVHRRELRKFAESAEQKGLTLIPVDVHLKRGFVKVTLAVAKGRKVHDKRDKLKERESDRALRDVKRKFL